MRPGRGLLIGSIIAELKYMVAVVEFSHRDRWGPPGRAGAGDRTIRVAVAVSSNGTGPTTMIDIAIRGLQLQQQADESTAGPASFVAVNPDGNPILVDQHV